MQNMKNEVSVCTYLLFYMIINKNRNYLTPILLHNNPNNPVVILRFAILTPERLSR